MSSSMYEVFHWASTSECPKKLTLSLAGSSINIDEPPSRAERARAAAAAAAATRKGNPDLRHGTLGKRAELLPPFAYVFCFTSILLLQHQPNFDVLCFFSSVYTPIFIFLLITNSVCRLLQFPFSFKLEFDSFILPCKSFRSIFFGSEHIIVFLMGCRLSTFAGMEWRHMCTIVVVILVFLYFSAHFFPSDVCRICCCPLNITRFRILLSSLFVANVWILLTSSVRSV